MLHRLCLLCLLSMLRHLRCSQHSKRFAGWTHTPRIWSAWRHILQMLLMLYFYWAMESTWCTSTCDTNCCASVQRACVLNTIAEQLPCRRAVCCDVRHETCRCIMLLWAVAFRWCPRRPKQAWAASIAATGDSNSHTQCLLRTRVVFRALRLDGFATCHSAVLFGPTVMAIHSGPGISTHPCTAQTHEFEYLN